MSDSNLVYVEMHEFPNGAKYKGQMLKDEKEKENFIRDGYGIQKWKDDSIY